MDNTTNTGTRRIVFLTGTRADFGKLKPLIQVCRESSALEVHVFATGMHLQKKYGNTIDEILNCGFENVFRFMNHTKEESMDRTLAKTIEGLSGYVSEYPPDLLVVHGDRVEALAGAIVGALNNVLVAHVEGGELSGTVDELIRHSVTKLSHLHFVANDEARRRLVQMGEQQETIFVIGSPDIDIMMSDQLPTLDEVKRRYEISHESYSILMFHPVTTEYDQMQLYATSLVDAVLECDESFVVIYPNNDRGSDYILNELRRLEGHPRFRIFPSVRFEYFLTLLKNSDYIIGNSSAGIREAPYYGVPCVNIGTRQQNRAHHEGIYHTGYAREEIAEGMKLAKQGGTAKELIFGDGKSAPRFLNTITEESFWSTCKQKRFRDI